jgi:hypothetical protein
MLVEILWTQVITRRLRLGRSSGDRGEHSVAHKIPNVYRVAPILFPSLHLLPWQIVRKINFNRGWKPMTLLEAVHIQRTEQLTLN